MDYETGRSQRALMDALYEKPAQFDHAADRFNCRQQAEKVALQRALLHLLRQNPQLLTHELLDALGAGYSKIAEENPQYFSVNDISDYKRRLIEAVTR